MFKTRVRRQKTLATPSRLPRRLASCVTFVLTFVLIVIALSVSSHTQDIPLSQRRDRRRHLYCAAVQSLVTGEWLVNEREGLTWWEARDCFVHRYDSAAAAKVLSSSRVTVLGSDNTLFLVNEICMSVKDACSEFHSLSYSLTNALFDIEMIIAQLLRTRTSVVLLHWGIERQTFTHSALKLVSALRSGGFSGRIVLVVNASVKFTKFGPSKFLSEKLTAQGTELMDFTEFVRTHLRMQQSLCSCTRRKGIKCVRKKRSRLPLDEHCRLQVEAQLQVVTVQLVLNALDNHITGDLKKFDSCGTCAVVSSAGYLLNSQYGAIIDQADFVVRVSASPVTEYEKFVGSRTDLRILRHSTFDGKRGTYEPEASDNILLVHDDTPNATSPFGHYKNKHLLTKRLKPYMNYKRPAKHNMLKDPILKCLSESRDVSTGMWSIFLVTTQLDFCCQTKLYGFLGHKFLDEPYHYYVTSGAKEDLRRKSTGAHYESRVRMKGGHNFLLEHRCIEKMISDELIVSVL